MAPAVSTASAHAWHVRKYGGITYLKTCRHEILDGSIIPPFHEHGDKVSCKRIARAGCIDHFTDFGSWEARDFGFAALGIEDNDALGPDCRHDGNLVVEALGAMQAVHLRHGCFCYRQTLVERGRVECREDRVKLALVDDQNAQAVPGECAEDVDWWHWGGVVH